MARDAVTLTSLSLNGSVVQPAGTAITPANGASIDVGGDARGVIIRVANTAASALNVTFQSGNKPPAELASLGDLVEQIAATSGVEYFVLEGGRFIQADGTIWADFDTGMTGTIMAFRLPQGG